MMTPFGPLRTPVHVLVVEDNDDGRESLCTLLGLHGYRVTGTATGRGALALLAEDTFDAMVLDLGLPDIDGTAVLHAARSVPRRPATIIFTGYHRLRDGTDVADCDAFILKPDLDRLLARLHALITGRSQDEPPKKIGGVA